MSEQPKIPFCRAEWLQDVSIEVRPALKRMGIFHLSICSPTSHRLQIEF
jgi:hypothetical protein